MMYGVAASGKSSLAKYIKKNKEFPYTGIRFSGDTEFDIIEPDNIRRQFYKERLEEVFRKTLDPEVEKKVWGKVMDLVENNIKYNIDTILDSTMLIKDRRTEMLDHIRSWSKKYGTNIILILAVVDTPLETILKWNKKRPLVVNEEVIRYMYEKRYDKNEKPDFDTEKYNLIFYFEPLKYKII